MTRTRTGAGIGLETRRPTKMTRVRAYCSENPGGYNRLANREVARPACSILRTR
jgi:hypothetical protein